jgi:phenylpyruvate tautomerase PptA (4-oxalocrotonate tautomerase family)
MVDNVEDTDLANDTSEDVVVETPSEPTSDADVENQSEDSPSEESELLQALTQELDDPEKGDSDVLDITKPIVDETEETKETKSDNEQDEDQKSSETSAEADDNDDQESETDQDSESNEISSVEFRRMNSKTRRKVKRLAELADKAAELEPHATAAKDLQNYLKETDIDNDDFKTLLSLGASLRSGDFKGFLQGVEPYMQLAQQAVGSAIPADLEGQVLAGQITEQMARQIGQDRVATQMQIEQAQRANTLAQQQLSQTQADQRQNAQTAITEAVNLWENNVRQTDPDYAKKEKAVRSALQARLANGLPPDPQTAIALVKDVYAEVNDMVKDFAPRPKPTQRTPNALSNANPSATPEPRTLAEAAMQGLRNAQ